MTKLTLVSLQDSLPPLGLAYIASYLREYGDFNNTKIVSVDLLHNLKNERENLDRGVVKIKKSNPDIIGISSVTQEFGIASQLARILKSVLDVPIIVGGPHITAIPYTLPESFDIAVLGEGEQTILELIKLYEKSGFNKNQLKKIKGIAFHNSNKVYITEERELIRPLDRIPLPARDLVDMKRFTRPRWVFGNYRRRGTHILTSRGCPYNCVFCSTRNFWRIPRFFSAEYVIKEIKELIEKYRVEAVTLYDDLFMANKNRIKKLAELIKEEGINEKVEFFAMARANLFNKEMAKLLKEMNFKALSFGFESMSPKILSYLKRNSVTVEQNRRAVSLCKKYGIDCLGMFIIGSPGETHENIMSTINFIKKSDILHDIYILTPFPGTELWEYAKARGLVNDYMNWDKVTMDFYDRVTMDFSNNLEENVIVADKVSREDLLNLLKIANTESRRKSYESFNFKLKDLLSAATINDFISHPRVFTSSVAKIFYYKLKKYLQ